MTISEIADRARQGRDLISDDIERNSQLWHLYVAINALADVRENFKEEPMPDAWVLAHSIIEDLRTSLAPLGLRSNAAWEKWQARYFWRRWGVDASLMEGADSEWFYDPERSAIERCAAVYLEQRWLRHAFVDFAIVDSLITSCANEIGASVRNTPIAGGLFNALLYAAILGAKNYSFVPILFLLARFLAFVGVYLIPSVAGVYFANAYGLQWLLVVSIVWGLWGLFRSVFRFGRALVVKLFRHETPRDKLVKVWVCMADLHRLLQGEVLQPSLIRQKLAEARSLGAVLPQAIDVILLDRQTRDADSWIVNPSLEGVIAAVRKLPEGASSQNPR